MIPLIFIAVGSGFAGFGVTGLAVGRLSATHAHAVMAIANILLSVGNVLSDQRVLAYVNAGVAALAAWLWWHSGGGDDTKRRLKGWAGRFQGVRRTAPSHA